MSESLAQLVSLENLELGRWVSNRAINSESTRQDVADEDARLVAQALTGDTKAYRVLVERYERKAHAIALGVLGNFQDAEDVTQESFIKAFRNLRSFRGHSSFYTWLYRIVYNMSIDFSRKKYRRVERAVGEKDQLDHSIQNNTHSGVMLGHVHQPDEISERDHLATEIKEALENLSEEHRTVIMLREVEGLSYEEISNVVGCSKGTVMSRLHHARRRLQQALRPLVPANWFNAVDRSLDTEVGSS